MTEMTNSWIKKKGIELKQKYPFCANPMCKSLADEFAHLEPTGLNGSGRGRNKRILDILKNEDKYVRLCKRCHDLLDNES